MLARGDQNMCRSLGIDIRKGVALLILIDSGGRNCAFNDFANRQLMTASVYLTMGGEAQPLHWAGMRLFVGIPVAAATVLALQELTSGLHAGEDGLRWLPPESWHITLQFLGETSDERFACLRDSLQAIKARRLTIDFAGITTFERVGVVAVAVASTGDLVALHRCVTQATARCGLLPSPGRMRRISHLLGRDAVCGCARTIPCSARCAAVSRCRDTRRTRYCFTRAILERAERAMKCARAFRWKNRQAFANIEQKTPSPTGMAADGRCGGSLLAAYWFEVLELDVDAALWCFIGRASGFRASRSSHPRDSYPAHRWRSWPREEPGSYAPSSHPLIRLP